MATVNFTTPGASTWAVPAGVTSIQVDAYGGAGYASGALYVGGLGGHAQATVPVTPGQILSIYVGQSGNAANPGPATNGSSFGAGGLNNGSITINQAGASSEVVHSNGTRLVVAGGGGANGQLGTSFPSPPHGGAGGAGGGGAGGAGGGISAGGAGGGGTSSSGGAGGTGTVPGSIGTQASGGPSQAGLWAGGGGGGGFWGGGSGGAGGGASSSGGGGGGGANGFDVSVTSTTNAQGINVGNGSIVITYTAVPPGPPTNVIATLGSADLTLNWNPPLYSDPLNPVTNYSITPFVNGIAGSPVVMSSTALLADFAFLVGAGSIYFSIFAVNDIGNSVPVLSNTIISSVHSLNSQSQISIVPVGYDSLQLQWTLPTNRQFNEIVLMRSAFGNPTSVVLGDGVVLLDQTTTPFSTSFLDSGLRPGHFYYYSLFIFDTTLNQYSLVAAAQGLVISYYGFDKQFYTWMPDWYLDQDALQPGNPLEQFMALIGYEMDWLRSEIESFFLFSNVELVSGALLPYVAANFGITYEPELGMARSRVLVKNAVFLYKHKGTVTGIDAAASAFSGYPSVITIGPNLEIQLDDSAFDQSVGHWVKGNSTSTITSLVASSLSITPAHNSYVPATGYVGYLPQDNVRIGEFTATGQPAYFSTCTSLNVQTLGIPVTQQATPPMYVLSASFQPTQAATPTKRSFFMQIDWDGQYGQLISSSVGATVTEIYGQWVRAYVAASPPAGAVWFGRTFKSTANLAGDLHLIDAEQVEINTQATPGPTAWQPPRDIKVNLLPIRQNLIANPQGKAGIAGWSSTGGLIQASASMATPPAISWPAKTTSGFVITAQPSSSGVSGAPVYGGIVPGSSWFGGAIEGGTFSAPGPTTVFTAVPVNPQVPYSLSIYMRALTAARTIQLSVGYFDALGHSLSPTVFTAVLSQSLVKGTTYSSLQVNPIPSFAVVQNEEALIINPGAGNQQLIHTSGIAAGGATSISVGQFQASDDYPAGTSIAFSYVNFTDTVGSFIRAASINLVTPANASIAQISLTVINPSSFEIHYLGATLFEPLSYLLPYFDANFLPATDYLWEGTANASVSDYYPALPSKLSRLITALPAYIPVGSTFSLITGKSALVNAGMNG